MISNFSACLILATLLVGLTIIGAAQYPRARLPILIHNGVWALTLVGVGSGLVRYDEFPVRAWLVLAVALLSFNVGAWASVGSRKDDQGPGIGEAAVARETTTTRSFLIVLLTLYMLGFGAYIYTIAQRFGLGALIYAPAEIRGAKGESYLASVALPFRLLWSLGPVAFCLLTRASFVDRPFPRIVRYGLLVILGLSMLAMLQRTNFFFTLILWICLRWTHSGQSVEGRPLIPKQKQGTLLRTSLAAGLLCILLVAAFQSLGGALGKTSSATRSDRVSTALANSGGASLFTYATSGVPAFLSLTESTDARWPPEGRIVYGEYNPQTWGAATFEQLLSLAPNVRTWNPVAPFTDVGVKTNVYTWLEPLYRDFRAPGVAAGSFLIGFLVTRLSCFVHSSAQARWLQALLMVCVVFGIFAPKYNSTMFLVSCLVVVGATASLSRSSAGKSGDLGLESSRRVSKQQPSIGGLTARR